MAQIRETLTLEDRFSAAFTRFLSLGNKASGATSRAQRALQNYESVMDSLDRQTISLNGRLAAMTQKQAEMATKSLQNTKEYQRLEGQIRQLTGTLKGIESQYAAVAADADLAARAAKKFGISAQGSQAQASGLMSTVRSLAGTFLGMQSVKWLANTSDQLTQTNARLQLMTGSAEAAAEANDQIFAAAMRSRGAYADMADTVAKLGTLAPNAFTDTGEIIAFAEQLQKQMALSGTSTQGAQAAMLQLTQGLASGVLRGEELNSILEQTPMIAQTIAEYMGVTTGEMRELASEGAVTAEVVKNAMLGAAEETNAAFEQMPMTWSQVWTSMQNIALRAMQPILDGINWMANSIDEALNWISENADGVTAVLAGLAAMALVVGSKMVISAMASAIAWAAVNWPILLVGAAVTALVYMALKAGVTFEQMGAIIGGVFGAIYAFAMNKAIVPLQRGFAAVANFIGNVFNDPVTAVKVLILDMVLSALEYLSTLANAIENLLNKIPGVSVDLTSGLDRITGNVTAARQAAIDSGNYKEYVQAWDYVDYSDAWTKGSETGSKLGKSLDEFSLDNLFGGLGDMFGAEYDAKAYDELLGDTGNISDDVSSINKSVNMADEDLKNLVDMAERQYVNQINLTAQTPVVTINGANTGNTEEDRRKLGDTIRDIILEQAAAGSYRSTARAYSGG